MKLLWVSTNFLHPTTKGGQIRTLEILRRLHHRHEIHYVAIEDPACPEGPRRSSEYSNRAYPLLLRLANKRSAAFIGQLATGLFSPMPIAVGRFTSPKFRPFLENLIRQERFERAVVDFLPPTAYFPDLAHSVLFQHNVETMIWRRHLEHASDPLRRFYLGLQARRMFEYERRICQAMGHIIAVSRVDAETMRQLFGVARISHIPTGVDIGFFSPPPASPHLADLVFIGSMDWLPNIDGVLYFVHDILPLIRRRRPDCSLVIAGRTPPKEITRLAERDPRIVITGTVPDIRPYLWGGSISIVPLRIGGGTRLKIYESMSAKIPVVSTSIGAEGLEVSPPENIHIADSPDDFAARCLELLENSGERARMAAAAWEMVRSRFSWDRVACCFEQVLETAPRLS